MPSTPPSAHPVRRWARRLGRLPARFARCRDGATAVEFGFVALPFMMMLFAIIEMAMTFWTTQALETAVANASRQIYTGQFQTDSANQNKTAAELQAKFKTLVCANVTALFDCNSLVTIDVRPVSTYSDAASQKPVTNGQYDVSGYGYQNSGANQITLVRASMQYPAFSTFFASSSGLTNGYRLIMATAVFRTEPYSS